MAGADAHHRYEPLFGLIQNHVLLDAPLSGDFSSDRRALIDSLSRGRSYIGVDALAPAGGFFFEAKAGGTRYGMGDTVPLLAAPRLRAGGCLPKGAQVELFQDGRQVASAEGSIEAPAESAGVYRVQVSVPGWSVPWVVSNPIYVFDAKAAEARRQAAAWTEAEAPPGEVRVLDDFEGKTVFEPGADRFTAMTSPLVDPKGGVAGSGAARIEFELGKPTPDHPDVFAAMVAWGARDLTGFQGLTFAIRSDRPYRIWVQVRDENPASTDEGTEWWFTSVKTSGEWRRVAIPFSRLRSVNPHTDGKLDLDQVRAIVFVLDKGSVKPGTRGSIFVDEVGFY
jgi:hypothetical protein